MGKNQRLVPDPALAKPHAIGATVTIVQTLAHSQLGAISYTWPRFWTYHYEASYANYEELAALHGRLAAFPVSVASMRIIDDQVFLKAVHRVGIAMLSDVVRTIQHFAEEIERTTGRSISGNTVNDRLRQSTAAADLRLDTNDHGYAAFVEIQELRDSVEHPKADNVYAGQQGRWDQVPLAWLLSDRSLRAYDRYHDWFTGLADEWEVKRGSYAGPAELQLQRGVRSELQFKKPPK